MSYTILVLDHAGHELSNTEVDTLKAAKASARQAIKDRENLDAGAHKAEVRDAKGVCVFDKFVPSPPVKQTLATIRALGLSVRHTRGEYCINFRNGLEFSAYYTSDASDAIDTARAMLERLAQASLADREILRPTQV